MDLFLRCGRGSATFADCLSDNATAVQVQGGALKFLRGYLTIVKLTS
jgi:hypothetical protein